MIFFICALLTLLSLHAEETPIQAASVSSSSADYNGNTLVLRGNVALDHGLGKMQAEEAELERQETGKDFPFSLIHLKKDVLLLFKDRGKLQCSRADLDFQTMKGQLSSDVGARVVYVDRDLVSVASQTAELSFAAESHDGKKTLFDVETLTAKENVAIEYGQGYALFADAAIYYKNSPQDKKTGLILAYPNPRLVHEGDSIHAEKAELHIAEKKFTMLKPQGTLTSSLLPHAEGGKTHFTCDALVWDEQKNQLQLKGHVHVVEEAFGVLDTEGELLLVHTMQKGKRVLNQIKSKGPSTLQLQKGPKLLSQGTISVDRKHLHALLESPRVKGVVPQEKQLYFEEERLHGNADQAVIDFSIADKTLSPQSIVLRGNVRLYSAQSCGLADRISYSPATQTVILMADPGKKVLFWGFEENLRLSAPEIHLTLDPITHKEVVKGIGNVQFTFSTEENTLLKKIFPSFEETAR